MRRAALALAVLCLAAGVAFAQTPADSPLAKRVTLNLRDVALRDALDRIAVLANIRLSYSGDNLPLDRRVSVSKERSLVSEVLAELLGSFAVEPRVVAPDHVVLAPREPGSADTVSREIAMLSRVVVTGNVIAAPERNLPIALDVVSGREIERRDQAELSQVFDGSVPGMWMWEQAPTSMLARYGSIRGASSFGLSFPKVYVDGIEVANPLLLTQITPELVERVEVIRGPQGASLYGSDAISGVVNIVSRHEGGGVDGTHVRLRSQAGFTSSVFSADAVAVQEHTLTLRRGTNLRSSGITIGGSTAGEYIPDAYSRDFRTIGDVRLIGSKSTITAGARFYGKNAGVPVSPLLPVKARLHADSEPQRLRMYSMGSTVTYVPGERWTYALTAGFDGYSLSNVSSELSAISFFVDSALRAASGSATRGTMRGSAVTHLGAPERVGATVTIAAEQSVLRERSLAELAMRSSSGPGPGGPGAGAMSGESYRVEWSGNTGLTTQLNLAVREALYLTAGLRNESIGLADGNAQFATLPMVGGAFVRDLAGVTAKVRVAYGKGIRAARATSRISSGEPRLRLSNPNLQPEEQSGIEGGLDLLFGRAFGLHLTRFDQIASGLLQTVTLADTAPNGDVRYLHQLQNVGEISNRGWETQAKLGRGALSLAGAATFVDSRVRKAAILYTGDLRTGDRMLGVPARTISGTVSWSPRRASFSTTLSRASDWINYDRLGIAECLVTNCSEGKNLAGWTLRRFWKDYPGNTRLRSTATYDLPRGFVLLATGENLLDHQRGEPDSITIVPGRTITLGMKARF